MSHIHFYDNAIKHIRFGQMIYYSQPLSCNVKHFIGTKAPC